MTAPITPAEIARLRELIAAATPMPWSVEDLGEWSEIRHSNGDVTGIADPGCGSMATEDANLAVASVNDLPALLSHLDAQAAEIERLRSAMESPRYQDVPESGNIIRRCERCGGLTEVPSLLSQCGISGCRSCVAEARARELGALLREIGNAYHDNRAGGCPGAGDRLDDAVARIDAALTPPTAAGAAGGEVEIERRCPHGIRHPHQCRECEDAIPQSEVDAFRMKMEADKAAGGEVGP